LFTYWVKIFKWSTDKSILNLWVSLKPTAQRLSVGLNGNETENQFHDCSLEIIIPTSQKKVWQPGTEEREYVSHSLKFLLYLKKTVLIYQSNSGNKLIMFQDSFVHHGHSVRDRNAVYSFLVVI
jgi:hypothetical protein